MEVILGQFTKSLAASGLMTAEEVDSFIEGLPPDKKPDDGKALAQALVHRGKLTKFQAQAVFQGKTKGLIMGDYVVLDRIGQGGMGQVYKARHKFMERIVALKTLPSEATKKEEAVKRFQREVKVAARLSHPNIVTAHDAGESQGVHYLVMEHVEGRDLDSHVKKHGRLPIETALDYTLQAARGLEYAHSNNVVHRDIKPPNLILNAQGTVKVLDMGIARLSETIGPYDPTAQESLTGTGEAMGTVDYMPPEQAMDAKTVDKRADIYSLGCTLFYLLTSHSVYGGDTMLQRLLAHRDAEIPSLRAERPDVSEQLDAAFQKTIAKKPEDRYGSMVEVIAELEACTAPKPEQLAETANLGNTPLSSDVETFPAINTETPADSLPLDFPVISPVDSVLRKRPKMDKKQQIIIGSVVVGIAFVLLLFGVVFMMRTPEGMLVVTVNEADAEIVLDDGKVTLKSPGEEPVEIKVVEGKHTLRVTKGGFQTFTKEFSIASGGEETISVELESEIESDGKKTTQVNLSPAEQKVAAKPVPEVASSGKNRVKVVEELPVVEPDDATPKTVSPPSIASLPDEPKSSESIYPASQPPPAIAPFTPEQAKQHQKAWANHLKVPVEAENSVGMKMVLIPPGEFMMGSPDSDPDAEDHEKPQHEVRITKPFYLAAHEVTAGQFKAFVDATGYKTEAETAGDQQTWTNPRFLQFDVRPVGCVSWNDAVAFCEWLSEKEGETYQLPSEAEWEYGCRSGSTTLWCFGNNETGVEEYAWCSGANERFKGERMKLVGVKLPNGFGLFDMHGNACEWCSDWYSPDFYDGSPVEDPRGPSNGDSRVIRGGSFWAQPWNVRSAKRVRSLPSNRVTIIGLRPAKTYP